jgi:integrase
MAFTESGFDYPCLHIIFPLNTFGFSPIKGSLPMVCVVVLAAGGTSATPVKQVPISAAIEELIEIKQRANLRPTYIRSLRRYLRAFARGREDRPISDFDEDDIEAWFLSRDEAPSSRASNLGRLASLFSYARRRRWITESPYALVERIRVDLKTPRILTVDECEKLLRFCEHRKPVALAYVALALLAGVRPEEIARLSWDCIDFAGGTLRIDAAASKVHKRRIVSLQPSALSWLKLAQQKGATLPVSRITRVRYLHAFRVLLDMEAWPQDCLRHTAASYWLAHWQDAGKVAHELGNSAAILLRHYRELVTKEDTARFWALMPKSPQA